MKLPGVYAHATESQETVKNPLKVVTNKLQQSDAKTVFDDLGYVYISGNFKVGDRDNYYFQSENYGSMDLKKVRGLGLFPTIVDKCMMKFTHRSDGHRFITCNSKSES